MLITGGTGSLGSALVGKILKTGVDVIRLYSRDELKQVQMRAKIKNPKLEFLIGDVRDKERLNRAMEGIDAVIHTAALKHVPMAEYNPFEFVKTNVLGTENVLDASLNNDVKLVVGIGTDKASYPINTYGATKLLLEKLFAGADFHKGDRTTKFVCVRYGNVLGSRGSILPKFIEQINANREITITDPNMTRFNITMDDAISLIFRAAKNGFGGEVFVPKLSAYTVKDMSDTIIELMGKKVKKRKIPVMPGEKYHETLIGMEDIKNTFETKEDYIIKNLDTHSNSSDSNSRKKTVLTNSYSSNNVKLLTKDEIKKIIKEELSMVDNLK